MCECVPLTPLWGSGGGSILTQRRKDAKTQRRKGEGVIKLQVAGCGLRVAGCSPLGRGCGGTGPPARRFGATRRGRHGGGGLTGGGISWCVILELPVRLAATVAGWGCRLGGVCCEVE